ncbi:hypothetical protein [Azospirillum endophyticum]
MAQGDRRRPDHCLGPNSRIVQRMPLRHRTGAHGNLYKLRGFPATAGYNKAASGLFPGDSLHGP